MKTECGLIKTNLCIALQPMDSLHRLPSDLLGLGLLRPGREASWPQLCCLLLDSVDEGLPGIHGVLGRDMY